METGSQWDLSIPSTSSTLLSGKLNAVASLCQPLLREIDQICLSSKICPLKNIAVSCPHPPPKTLCDLASFLDASGRNGCCLAYQGLPLSGIMDILSSRTQIHRLPVVDKEGRLVGKRQHLKTDYINGNIQRRG